MPIVIRILLLVLAVLASAPAGAAPAQKKPVIVLISGEHEYFSSNTLPVFQRHLEQKFPVTCRYLQRDGEHIPGLDQLGEADLVILYVRRMTLPAAELEQVRKYVDSGKPLIGLRTASHAFQNWKEFDRDVLGGNYGNHHGNKLTNTVRVAPAAANHPILKGVAREFSSPGSLYKNTPLSTSSQVLLIGTVPGHPPEPVAWTHNYRGARVFYTSLGHPADFDNESFRALLENAVWWALEKN